MYCPAIVIVTMYFERRRGLATGIAVCGAGFGTFLFAPLSDYLIAEYTWRGALLIYSGMDHFMSLASNRDSAIILNCVACGALFRPLEWVPVYADELEADGDQSMSAVELNEQLMTAVLTSQSNGSLSALPVRDGRF
jgi:MFS family permease